MFQAQTDPKYGAGTYLYQLPWGPEGLLGIAGTFGLWLALMALVSELIRHTPTAKLARWSTQLVYSRMKESIMDKSKRRFIKGAAVTGGVGLFARVIAIR